MISRMWLLLVFRWKFALVKFWRQHPAVMAPLLALTVCAGLPVSVVSASIWAHGWGEGLGFLKPFIILGLSAPSGALLAWGMFRWAPTITRQEQQALFQQMPACVPMDRRICMLERDLIVSTQGAQRAAWACEQQLQLSTRKATGQRRGNRL